jgi:hypothetical protein
VVMISSKAAVELGFAHEVKELGSFHQSLPEVVVTGTVGDPGVMQAQG